MPRLKLSASQISLYLACPRKFFFKYVGHLPPEFYAPARVFGSAVHGALDWFHRERIEGRTPEGKEAIRILHADWTAELEKPVRWEEDDKPEEMLATAETLVRLYVGELGAASFRASEVKFVVELVDPVTGEVFDDTLGGYFDLVLDGDELWEVKTAKHRWDENAVKYNLQLSAYAYAFRQLHGRSANLSIVTLLKYKKPRLELVPAKRTDADDAFFVQVATEVARGIRAEAFPPNPTRNCATCEFATACSSFRGRTVALAESRSSEPGPPHDGRSNLTEEPGASP